MFFNDIDVTANVRTLASIQFAFHTIRIHGHTIDGFFDVFGYLEFARKSCNTVPLLNLIRHLHGLLSRYAMLLVRQMAYYLP
jgi:hypothetical protein